MNLRPLGSTGVEVGEVGIGTWELAGDVWGPKDDAISLAALRAGLDAGANLIDTAADYGNGHVEELVGRLLVGIARDDVVIATKVRPECGVWAPRPELPIADFFRPAWIRSECEASLRRLGTDHVDVLFLHTWSRSWAHEDAWFETMAALKAEGKLRAIGISVADEGAGDANVAIARGRVDVVQAVYSVFQQEPEYTLLPLAAQHGVGVIARSPFSSGALVQQWTAGMEFPEGDWRATWPAEVKRDWLDEQIRMTDAVGSVMAGSGIDRPAFCLAYALGDHRVSAVLPGSANPDHVRANVAVSGGPGLDAATRQRVKALWLARTVHGTYNGSG
ncbi:MAG: aldo/keto reductase [Actinomycetota bacterium]|nr:aldo/keto reductase [Actinomycetota bacterium]